MYVAFIYEGRLYWEKYLIYKEKDKKLKILTDID